MFLFAMFTMMIFPRSWLPVSYAKVDLALRNRSPLTVVGDQRYWLGTDALGRDMMYRVLAGASPTLVIAGASTAIATLFGTGAGVIAGFYGGRTAGVVMRLVDTMLAFPTLLLALALTAAVGRSVLGLVGVLALSGWAGYARVIRSNVLILETQEFIEAARALGAPSLRIIRKHVLPNIVSPILVLSSFYLARFILAESAISFLGLGPAPPLVTWGGLIGEGRNYIYAAWWLAAVPGTAIFLTALVFNFMGDAVRDAFDPYSIGRIEKSD
jgi:peptide/nickel transport system permease protein